MRYKLLGQSGLRVSEVALGTMTFGEDWGWGADYATSRAIFDRYVEAGGNFIDTATNYTNGTSEKYAGEFVHSERDRFVLATKYTLRLTSDNQKNVNLGGNSRKAMMTTVERSLKVMNTDYIDLLYLHMWDYTTPVEEVLRGADDLVRQGKILYFAFSDTPSWVISSAIAKAEGQGWTRPIAVQVPYNLLNRDVEREVLPMARYHDLAIIPWGILGAGTLTGKYSDTTGDESKRNRSISDRDREAGEAVKRIAAVWERSPAQVAINWVRQQPGTVIPLLGCRKLYQIEDNLAALDFELTLEQMAELDQISGFRAGFPIDFLTSPTVQNLAHGEFAGLLDNHHLR
jgi:aryl-alcohol dehydrogenase-like predicted oxidoreductase